MPLSSAYNPKEWESQIASQWRKWKIGTPEVQVEKSQLPKDAPVYSIIMPPPNLTDKLHAGHGMNHFLQDTLSRIHRQRGYKTLLYPGVDHAGLQLEGVINKYLVSEGIDKKSLSTEEYLKICWQKVKEWRNGQNEQALMMGTSADYTRELFTLDERASNMVRKSFKQYWQDGLIYKSSYIVNWSVSLQTALSDVSGEIVYETRIDPLITFAYGISSVSVQNGDVLLVELAKKLEKILTKNPIMVATVRPETIWGDVAVAIHPTVLRQKLHKQLDDTAIDLTLQSLATGDLLIVQKLPEFEIEARLLISDKVDPEFGTGALKITPGSDVFDYELYTKDFGMYQLPKFIQPIDRQGNLSKFVPKKFQGMSRELARIEAIKLLIEAGYVKKIKEESTKVPKEYIKINGVEFADVEWNYEHNVSLCERTKTIIEPLVSEEFYVSYDAPTRRDGKNLRDLARLGVSQTNFYPIEFRTQADNFLDNLKDWCISRDLVWGHKIPVWYNLVLNPKKTVYPFVTKTVEVEGKVYDTDQLIQVREDKPVGEGDWVQETKILDTWFSSSLWPLSTLGYYETNPKIKAVVVDVSGVFWDEKNKERSTVVKFLEHAKQTGITILYASNMNNQVMYQAFTNTPNFGLFDGGVSSYQSGQDKKSGGLYDLLLSKYDLDPQKVLYLDDVSEFVTVAKEKEIKAFWYTPGTDINEVFAEVTSSTTSDFETFYPTDYMNTAKEIFYLWIVRMIMLGTYFTGTTPFKNVLITPTVLDGKGKKMSKSLKNGLQPEDAIERFSSDILRFGMFSGVLPNRNMRFGDDVADRIMEKMRNFGNKLWNIGRFLEYKLSTKKNGFEDSEASDATNWIVGEYSELLDTIEQVTTNYEFTPVVDSIIDFVWYKFADSYIEYLKTDESQLGHAWKLFEHMLTSLHPFIPFETEVLARELFGKKTLVFEQLDQQFVTNYKQDGQVNSFELCITVLEEIRSIKGVYGIKPTEKIEIDSEDPIVLEYADFLKLVAKVSIVDAKESWFVTQVAGVEIKLNIEDAIQDIDQELARTEKEVQSQDKIKSALEGRLSNPKFVENAEEEVIEQTKTDLKLTLQSIENLKGKLVYLHTLNQQ
jgi:valyl-tRNA synthetase